MDLRGPARCTWFSVPLFAKTTEVGKATDLLVGNAVPRQHLAARQVPKPWREVNAVHQEGEGHQVSTFQTSHDDPPPCALSFQLGRWKIWVAGKAGALSICGYMSWKWVWAGVKPVRKKNPKKCPKKSEKLDQKPIFRPRRIVHPIFDTFLSILACFGPLQEKRCSWNKNSSMRGTRARKKAAIYQPRGRGSPPA